MPAVIQQAISKICPQYFSGPEYSDHTKTGLRLINLPYKLKPLTNSKKEEEQSSTASKTKRTK
jgi:hypothetical protein